jgi:hypothetical protein
LLKVFDPARTSVPAPTLLKPVFRPLGVVKGPASVSRALVEFWLMTRGELSLIGAVMVCEPPPLVLYTSIAPAPIVTRHSSSPAPAPTMV